MALDVPMVEEASLHHMYKVKTTQPQFLTFAAYAFLCAVLGALVGGITNATIQYIQKDDQNNDKHPAKISCAAFGAANIVVIVIYMLLFNMFITFRNEKMNFNDWIWSTMAGFLSVSCFFVSQVQLADNISCLLKFN